MALGQPPLRSFDQLRRLEGVGSPGMSPEEAIKTTTAKQRTNQRAMKLADFDWRKFYDKETQEKLLAGCAIS
jgi:hypothetical protein